MQLHLHPEWADEIRPLPFDGARTKRQLLSMYTREEQAALIALGRDLLRQVDAPEVDAFRAGSFAANRDTFRALSDVGLQYDGSLNTSLPYSGPDLRDAVGFDVPDFI